MCIDEPIKFIFPCLIGNNDDDDDVIAHKHFSKKIIRDNRSKSFKNSKHIEIDRYANYKPVTRNIKMSQPNSNILDLNYKNSFDYNIKK